MFLRAFAGVPKADGLRSDWADVLAGQQEAANQHLGAYHKALRAGDQKGAFAAGLKALKTCSLTVYCANRQFLGGMEKLASDARKIGLERDEVAEFKSLHKAYVKALDDGKRAFESINRRVSL
jgi:hypothetical protein